MAKKGTKFENKFPGHRRAIEAQVDQMLDSMATDIVRLAEMKVPLKDGDLWGRIRKIKKAMNSYIVEVNSAYAAYQERGMRADGSRVVRNYTTGGTGPHFLKKSTKTVYGRLRTYFKKSNRMGRL